MEPDLRDPEILDDLNGLEVSLCTHNSQRALLSHLLGLHCMRSYLRNFGWGNKRYESYYLDSLYKDSWGEHMQDKAFRERFEKAVMLCLNVLRKTDQMLF